MLYFPTIQPITRRRDSPLSTMLPNHPENKDDGLAALRDKKVAAANYVVRTKDRDKFAEALDKEWPGPVPYTLVVAPAGKVIYRKAGAVEPLEVRRAVVGFLGRTY